MKIPRSSPFCPPGRVLRGFTLIELLVVVAILALLAAILFPVFGRVRENARRASCQSNLRQAGLGFHQYSQDYDERFPSYMASSSPSWDSKIEPYLGIKVANTLKASILQCPSDTIPRMFTSCLPAFNAQIRSYSMGGDTTDRTGSNILGQIVGTYIVPLKADGITPDYIASYFKGRPLSAVPVAASTLLLVEKTANNNIFASHGEASTGSPYEQTTQSCGAVNIAPIHFDGWNYLFVDGHVKWLDPQATINGPGKTGGTMTVPKGMWTLAEND